MSVIHSYHLFAPRLDRELGSDKMTTSRPAAKAAMLAAGRGDTTHHFHAVGANAGRPQYPAQPQLSEFGSFIMATPPIPCSVPH